jgi:predicted nucleic-acid-binding protein
MIAIDTNVLLRYFTQDDGKQAKVATKIIEGYTGKKAAIFINNIVLCELVWSLRGDYSKTIILGILKDMLATTAYAFEDRNLLLECVNEFEVQNCDFADIMIAKFNHQKYEYMPTITFDKKAAPLKECKLAE